MQCRAACSAAQRGSRLALAPRPPPAPEHYDSAPLPVTQPCSWAAAVPAPVPAACWVGRCACAHCPCPGLALPPARRVSLALHGGSAQTNFPASNYTAAEVAVYRWGSSTWELCWMGSSATWQGCPRMLPSLPAVPCSGKAVQGSVAAPAPPLARNSTPHPHTPHINPLPALPCALQRLGPRKPAACSGREAYGQEFEVSAPRGRLCSGATRLPPCLLWPIALLLSKAARRACCCFGRGSLQCCCPPRSLDCWLRVCPGTAA